ncbi:DUF1433 domain-containing protein [Listeria monocytogenes]|uniref:DUF1433 domain-containing protein n=1 Tax=Listeria monocytogenes TaxID=1639 RepID=UPI000BE03759|nr:DUF1433 domain-containing protein [Listeria monocytogenes]PDD02364.1 hypothetical protein A4P60_02750 [Listeria monocytogenes]PDD04511.1 hypothetical protein A4P58_08470 [Listeria monocytogenes]PDD24999.1 hypothetical protein A4P48_06525 [Listeria monocytogenes]PDD51739.1 hypothetical protein A4P38_05830 [Listeria monocytogenes]PDF55914.1 hypothetical protein A4P50_00130 [Listeria monocytogenes]
MQHQEQEKNQAFFNEQKEKVTLYLKHNIPDFKTVTFTNEEFNPIGISIDGYINNDKNLSFTAGKDVKIFSCSDELDKMFKEPRKGYDEIIEKEETSLETPKEKTKTINEILSDLKSYEDQIITQNKI